MAKTKKEVQATPEEVQGTPEEVQGTPDDRAYMMEKVTFYAFKDNGKYSADIFVGLNGKGYNIQRGVEVMIPRAVKEIAMRSLEQDQKTAQLIDKLSNEYKNESAKYS